MKKVGILSMQRVINYGSYLQAYALKQLLLQQGATSVEYIDIIRGKNLKGYQSSGFPYYLRRLKALLKIIAAGRIIEKRKTLCFMKQVSKKLQEAWKELGLKDYPYYPPVDLAVVGSDEVFHCCQSTSWGFTTQLYGNIKEAKEVVSYAASFGGTKLQDIFRLGIGEEIAKSLRRMKYISVRDDNSHKIVKNLTGREAEINLDPVLAYGFKQEIVNSGPVDENNYILLYSYPDRINDKKEIKAIKDFAKRTGKKLICVMSRYDWCDRAIIPTPLELFSWFKNADLVISETFHGTIFSIITERQFATIGRESALPKLTSMLQPYGLTDRLVSKDNSIDKIFSNSIDYIGVNEKLGPLREKAYQYITKIFQS